MGGLEAALATPGLELLIAISAIAGTVYGFAGFGSALIFMPLAILLVAPVLAVSAFSVAAVGSAVTVLPQAWRDADRRATLVMLGAAILMTPLGLLVLRFADVTLLRWTASLIVLVTLAALVSGWRYAGTPGLPAWLGVGAGVGFMGGATGLNGPVVILFQLAGKDGAARTRANTIVVLTLSSLTFLPLLWLQGAAPPGALALGLLLLVPYAVGARLGRALFDPARERLYRGLAYCIIGAAGLAGLPLWG